MWQPWLYKSKIDDLEMAQNGALCISTGLNGTPLVDAVLLIENGMQSHGTTSRCLCAVAHENAVPLPADHLRRTALEESADIGCIDQAGGQHRSRL